MYFASPRPLLESLECTGRLKENEVHDPQCRKVSEDVETLEGLEAILEPEAHGLDSKKAQLN